MYKLLKGCLAAAIAGFLVGWSPKLVLADWPGQSDSVYAYPIQTIAGNLTVTDYAINESGQTIAANSDRINFIGCVISTGSASLFYDFGTVDTAKSMYISTHTLQAAGGTDPNSRCFTTNVGGMLWQGPITLDVPTGATVTIRTWSYSK